MPFDARCPECGATFKLLDKERGQRFQCEGCAHVFVPGKEAKENRDIDEPPRRDKSALQRERSSKTAAAHWNPKNKDGDKPAKKGGSRRVGKPSSGGGSNIITVGVIAFFVVSAAGLGIWVAVQDRPAEPAKPGQPGQPFNQGIVAVNPDPAPGPGLFGGPPPDQPPPAPQIKDIDSDTLLARLNPQQHPWERNDAMMELARRKERRAIGPILQQFISFDRGAAENALRAFGAVAEKDVLPLINHPDDGLRDAARRLLKDFNTTQDLLITQSLSDLNAAKVNVQLSVLSWFAVLPRLPARAGEVARAEERFLTSTNGQLRDQAMRSLLTWGSKENTPGVVKLLASLPREGIPGDTHRWAIQALVSPARKPALNFVRR